MEPRTPFEALQQAVHSFITADRFVERHGPHGPNTRPGEVIVRLSAPTRQLLTRLTSDEALLVRPDEARLWIDRPGFCDHGWKFTEQCRACGRVWGRR